MGHQAITWSNVDPDPGGHMISLGHNKLKRFYDSDGAGAMLVLKLVVVVVMVMVMMKMMLMMMVMMVMVMVDNDAMTLLELKKYPNIISLWESTILWSPEYIS